MRPAEFCLSGLVFLSFSICPAFDLCRSFRFFTDELVIVRKSSERVKEGGSVNISLLNELCCLLCNLSSVCGMTFSSKVWAVLESD